MSNQATIKKLGRERLLFHIAERVVALGSLGLVAFWGSHSLDRWLAALGQTYYVRLLAAVLLTIIALFGPTFVLSIFSDYRQKLRFGIGTQAPSIWLWARKQLSAMSVAIIAAAALIATFLVAVQLTALWWIILSTMLAAIYAVGLLVSPLFYRGRYYSLRGNLRGAFIRLAEPAHFPVNRVKIMPDDSRAFISGIGPTTTMFLGDRNLQQPSEAKVTFAHELGHVVHHHGAIDIAICAMIGMCVFYCTDYLCETRVGHKEWRRPVHPALISFVVFTWTAAGFLVEPLVASVRRRHEYQCDLYSLRATGDFRAFQRTHTPNPGDLLDPDPHPLIVLLTSSSHPSAASRLRAAQRYAEQNRRE